MKEAQPEDSRPNNARRPSNIAQASSTEWSLSEKTLQTQNLFTVQYNAKKGKVCESLALWLTQDNLFTSIHLVLILSMF